MVQYDVGMAPKHVSRPTEYIENVLQKIFLVQSADRRFVLAVICRATDTIEAALSVSTARINVYRYPAHNDIGP